MRGRSVSERLASAIAAAPAPEPAVEAAVGRVLLDSLACALGAVESPPVQAARRWASRIAAAPYASIWGTGERGSVLGAALVNCTMTRDLDLNDTYFRQNPTHPSDSLGAILAVAEAEGASAARTVQAILVSFEIQMRAAEFTEVSYFRTTGWDHTLFIGIGTAAAVGVLLGLDEGRLAHALGIAACYPVLGGLRAGQISMMKAASAGLSASRGVEAAYLAREGLLGPLGIFDGKRGLEQLVLGRCDWELFAAPMGDWRLPSTCLKRYPAAYIIHAAIDAAVELRHEHGFAADDVDEVVVEAFGWLVEDMVDGMGGTSRYEVDSRETADHSLPFCVAVALVDGAYGPRQLAERRWEAPEVQRMLGKVRCVHDPALDRRFPEERPSRVTVVLAGGRALVREVPFPKGDPRRPLTDRELVAKLAALAPALGAGQRDAIAECALDFARRGVSRLVAACTMPGDRAPSVGP